MTRASVAARLQTEQSKALEKEHNRKIREEDRLAKEKEESMKQAKRDKKMEKKKKRRKKNMSGKQSASVHPDPSSIEEGKTMEKKEQWVAWVDEQTGFIAYYNEGTKESTWEKPSDEASIRYISEAPNIKMGEAMDDPEGLGDGWESKPWVEPSRVKALRALKVARFREGRTSFCTPIDDMGELGLGILLYFKFLKHFIITFFIMSIIVLPLIAANYLGSRTRSVPQLIDALRLVTATIINAGDKETIECFGNQASSFSSIACEQELNRTTVTFFGNSVTMQQYSVGVTLIDCVYTLIFVCSFCLFAVFFPNLTMSALSLWCQEEIPKGYKDGSRVPMYKFHTGMLMGEKNKRLPLGLNNSHIWTIIAERTRDKDGRDMTYGWEWLEGSSQIPAKEDYSDDGGSVIYRLEAVNRDDEDYAYPPQGVFRTYAKDIPDEDAKAEDVGYFTYGVPPKSEIKEELVQTEWNTLLRMSIPIFLMYGVGTPIVLGAVLFRQARLRNLKNPILKVRYGWVYTRFNERSWWFFAVVMMRKLSAVLIKVFANEAVLGRTVITFCAEATGYGGKDGRRDDFLAKGAAFLQVFLNTSLIVVMAILTIAVRPYRCFDCKLEAIEWDENQEKDSAQDVLSFEERMEKNLKEKERRMSTAQASAIVKFKVAASRQSKRKSRKQRSKLSRQASFGGDWWEKEEYESGVGKRVLHFCRDVVLARARKVCCLCCKACKCEKTEGLAAMEPWENCYHMSSTDRLHISFFMVQVYVLVFGLVFTLNSDGSGNSLFDTKFTWIDAISITIMLFLVYPFFATLRVTFQAWKALKKEKRATKKVERGTGCCAKLCKKVSDG
eukprot:g2377.t1